MKILVKNFENIEINKICIIGKTGSGKTILLKNIIEENNLDVENTMIITPNFNNYKNMKEINLCYLTNKNFIERRKNIINSILNTKTIKCFSTIIIEEFSFFTIDEILMLKEKLFLNNKNIIITLQEKDFFDLCFNVDDCLNFCKITMD